MSQSAGRPTRSPLYDPNAWLHYAEALEAENQQLRSRAERAEQLAWDLAKAMRTLVMEPVQEPLGSEIDAGRKALKAFDSALATVDL